MVHSVAETGRGLPYICCRDVDVARENTHNSISGLVVEYIVAIDVTRVRFPADARIAFIQSWIAEGGEEDGETVSRREERWRG